MFVHLLWNVMLYLYTDWINVVFLSHLFYQFWVGIIGLKRSPIYIHADNPRVRGDRAYNPILTASHCTLGVFSISHKSSTVNKNLVFFYHFQEVSKLRYQLCPREMKERKFWRIYFILVNSHVAPWVFIAKKCSFGFCESLM